MTVLLNIRWTYFWCALCLVLSGAHGALAQQAVPEILRKDYGSLFLLPINPHPLIPLNQTAAPVPDQDARAPNIPVQRLGIGPVFGGAPTGYRGESFTSGSTTNPGLRELRMPLSGFALRLHLD